jgi:hypothetical protein
MPVLDVRYEEGLQVIAELDSTIKTLRAQAVKNNPEKLRAIIETLEKEAMDAKERGTLWKDRARMTHEDLRQLQIRLADEEGAYRCKVREEFHRKEATLRSNFLMLANACEMLGKVDAQMGIDLNCPACLNVVQDALILSCGHCACRKCVEKNTEDDGYCKCWVIANPPDDFHRR